MAAHSARTDRRSAPRRAFPREVRISRGEKPGGGLVATDLSAAGMRVAATDLLELGDEISLALQDADGHAVRVKACVARDDGDQGWMLQFVGVDAATTARLETLVESLPEDGAADAGVVVSEILQHDERG